MNMSGTIGKKVTEVSECRLKSTGRQQKPAISSLRNLSYLRKLGRSLIVVFKISIVGKIQLSAVYLKVPKCENFHRTDFFYFFTIKPLWVGDFRAKIKN
jgi:hypothetical protein